MSPAVGQSRDGPISMPPRPASGASDTSGNGPASMSTMTSPGQPYPGPPSMGPPPHMYKGPPGPPGPPGGQGVPPYGYSYGPGPRGPAYGGPQGPYGGPGGYGPPRNNSPGPPGSYPGYPPGGGGGYPPQGWNGAGGVKGGPAPPGGPPQRHPGMPPQGGPMRMGGPGPVGPYPGQKMPPGGPYPPPHHGMPNSYNGPQFNGPSMMPPGSGGGAGGPPNGGPGMGPPPVSSPSGYPPPGGHNSSSPYPPPPNSGGPPSLPPASTTPNTVNSSDGDGAGSNASSQSPLVTTGPDGQPIHDDTSQQSTLSQSSDNSGGRQTPKGGYQQGFGGAPGTPHSAPSPGSLASQDGDMYQRDLASPSGHGGGWGGRVPPSPVGTPGPQAKVENLQRLYDLDDHPERRAWLDKLLTFMEDRGTPITQCPTISKNPLDLYRLYIYTKDRGGFLECTNKKAWKDIAAQLGIGPSSSGAYTLKKHYGKNLLPFECHFERGGVDPGPILATVEAQSKKKGKGAQSARPPSPGSQDSHDSFSGSQDGYGGGYPPPGFGNSYPPPGDPRSGPPHHPGPYPQSYPPRPPGPPPPGSNYSYGGPQGPQPPRWGGPSVGGYDQNSTGPPTSVGESGGSPYGARNAWNGPSSGGPPPPGSSAVGGNGSYPPPPGSGGRPGYPPTSGTNTPPNSLSSANTDTTTTPPTSQPFDYQKAGGAAPPNGTSSAPYPGGPPTSLGPYGGGPPYTGGPSPGPPGVGPPGGPRMMMRHQPPQGSLSHPVILRANSPATPGTIQDTLPPALPVQRIPNPHGYAPNSSQSGPMPPPGTNSTSSGGGPPGYPPVSKPGGVVTAGPPNSAMPPTTGAGTAVGGPGGGAPASGGPAGGPPPNRSPYPPQGQYPPPHRPMYPGGPPPPSWQNRYPPSQPYPPGSGPPRPGGPPAGPWGSPSGPSPDQRNSPYAPQYGGPGPWPPRSSGTRPGVGPPPPGQVGYRPEMRGPPQQISRSMGPGRREMYNFPVDCLESTQPLLIKRKKLNKVDVQPVDGWRLVMALRSGLLGESTWALDTLNILLYDDNSVTYFGLGNMPGLLEALIEHWRASLVAMFDLTKELEISNEKMDLSRKRKRERLEKTSEGIKWFEKRESPVEEELYLGCVDGEVLRQGDKVRILHHQQKDYTQEARFTEKEFQFDEKDGEQFIMSGERDWDFISLGYNANPDIWEAGGGSDTNHIIPANSLHPEIHLPFVRILKDGKEGREDSCHMSNGLANGIHEKENGTGIGQSSSTSSSCSSSSSPSKGSSEVSPGKKTGKKLREVWAVTSVKSEETKSAGASLPNNKRNGGEDKEAGEPSNTSTTTTTTDRNSELAKQSENNSSTSSSNNQDSSSEQKQKSEDINDIVKSELCAVKKESDEGHLSEAKEDVVEALKRRTGIIVGDEEGVRKRWDKPVLEEENYQPDQASLNLVTEDQDSLGRRAIAVSTIFRNLSFVPGNETLLSSCPGFLAICGRLMLHGHWHPERSSKQRNYERGEEEDYTDSCTSLLEQRDWWWEHIQIIRENVMVALSNITGHMDLSPLPESIVLPLLSGLLEWSVSPAAAAQDPFYTVGPSSNISPQRLAIESLCKLCITEGNVDLLLSTPPYSRLESLCAFLSRKLYRSEEQVMREFAINLLYYFSAADSGVARTIATADLTTVSLLIGFIEQAESNALMVAQQHGVNALRDNPDSMGTSLDMLRRAANTLHHLAKHPDNRTLFLRQEQRLLNLVMSQILDQGVAGILSQVIFQIGSTEGIEETTSSSTSSLDKVVA